MEAAKISNDSKAKVPLIGPNLGQTQSSVFKMVHNSKGLKKGLSSLVAADMVLNSK